MRIFCYSDTHIRDVGSFSPWNMITKSGLTKELENILKGFDFLHDKILETKPDVVCCLGDVYHSTEFLSNRTIHGSHLAMSRIKNACETLGIQHVIYNGNHDTLSEMPIITSISTLTGYGIVYTEYSHITIKGCKIAIVPYSSNLGKLYSDLVDAQSTSDLILTHLDFAGCSYESGSKSESNISPDLAIDCISGDIHLPQSIGKVNYPGSLVQHRFSQNTLDRVGGALIYDSDTQKVTRYPNTYSKHYVRVHDIEYALTIPPSKAVLQIITDKSSDEITELFKDYEYQYIPKPKLRGDEIKSVYSNFDEIDPVNILRSYIAETRDTAIDDFDEIIRNRK